MKRQIVIEIDEDVLLYYRTGSINKNVMIEVDLSKVTPLPKGHGDLVDRSKIYKAIPAEEDNCTGAGMSIGEMDAYNDGIDAMYSLIKRSPAIIEADKEE